MFLGIRTLKDGEKIGMSKKTYEELYGTERAALIKKKLSNCYKGTGMTGMKHTEESKEKIRKSKKGVKCSLEHIARRVESRSGYRHTEETKEKIRKGNIGWKHSNEAKLKMRDFHKGKSLPERHKENIRKGIVKYIEGKKLNGCLMKPNIGKNETYILDAIEFEFNVELDRQFFVCGYFVDGYDAENNTVYEVDEKYHLSEEQIGRDKLRQDNIEKELNCEFVRIKDE